MGIIAMLEFHTALARLVEEYLGPIEHDYYVY